MTLKQRIERLEALAAQADELTAAVGRLGDRATSLQTVIDKVDQNQQELTQLGKELATIQETAATEYQLQESAKTVTDAVRKERKRANKSIAFSILIGVAVLVSFLSYTQTRAYNSCLKRSTQIQVSINILERFRGPSSQLPGYSAKLFDQSIADYENARVDCTDSTPLRWIL